MKIIAKKTAEKGFIIDVTADEMANILGFNQLQEIDRSSYDRLVEGSEIDITNVFKSYRELDVQKLRDTITELQTIIASLFEKIGNLPSPSAEQALPARRKVTVPNSDPVPYPPTIPYPPPGTLSEEFWRQVERIERETNPPLADHPYFDGAEPFRITQEPEPSLPGVGAGGRRILYAQSPADPIGQLINNDSRGTNRSSTAT